MITQEQYKTFLLEVSRMMDIEEGKLSHEEDIKFESMIWQIMEYERFIINGTELSRESN